MPEKALSGTKEEGVAYVSSEGGYYEAPEITASKLRDFKDNIYGRGLSTKQKNLIFSDKYTIGVKDPKGEPDAELETTMMQMCESRGVRLWANMHRAFTDVFWYGIGVFNPVWGYENTEYRLLKLRHLPAYTFGNAPSSSGTKIYSLILPGITLNDKSKDIEFWQTDEDGTPKLIKSVFSVKDPSAQGLAGESIVLPVVPIIEMLKFSWDTQMQQVHRTGAKILFIKIIDPQSATQRSDGISDKDYALDLLQRWSKDMAFLLRDNMELIDPHIRDDANNLEVIDALHKMIIDYVTPTSFIAREGSAIGGSEKQREQMLLRYIKGFHTWLEDQFEMLLSQYLEFNGYVDYTVSVHIPSPSIDRSEIELKQGVEGAKAQVLTINEIRERFGAEGLSEEDIEKMLAVNERLQPLKPGIMEQLGIINAIKALGQETPRGAIKGLEGELKVAADRLYDNVLEALEKEGR